MRTTYLVAVFTFLAVSVGVVTVVWQKRRVVPIPRQTLPAGVFKGANVLLVTIDTLRADHVGSYGGAAGLTPHLDNLAREGLRFATAYTAVPMTLPAHTSLMTGDYPTVHGVRDNGSFRFDGARPTLASVLKETGYRTGAFVGAFVLDARFGLNHGFDHYDDFYSAQQPGTTMHVVERSAERVMMPAAAWIRNRSRPWFAWVHFYDPHEPYAPPEPFRSRYASDLYSGEIAYVDEQLGRLLDEVRSPGLLDNTLVIVAADHGEALGDHGERTHGLFAYNATLRVPLIVWHRRLRPGVFVPPVRLVDVMPFVLELVGAAVPRGIEGKSLRPAIAGEASYQDPGSYFEALNANLTRNWAPLSGIVHGGFKLIDLPVPELYDLNVNPGETQNLYAKRPDLARQLETRLDAVTRAARTPVTGAVDPDTAQRLRSLGYIVAPTATRKTSFTAGDDPKRLIELNQALDRAVDSFTRGSTEDAVLTLEQVIRERPDFTLAYDRLAFVYHETGRLPDAIAVLDRAINAGAVDAGLLAALGGYLQDAGQLDRSVSMLQSSLKMNASQMDAYEKLGVTYTKMGRPAEAEATFRTLLELDPDSATTYNNLGSLFLSLGRNADAIEDLTRALKLDPAMATAHNGLGVAYARTGRMDQAIEEWKAAASLNPRQFDTLYNVGTALLQLHRPDEARPYLEQFARTAPSDRYGADLRRVQQLLRQIDRGQ